MPKKIIQLVWTLPVQPITETFDADDFKIRTEDGLVKLFSNKEGGIVRIIPADKIQIIQFGESEPEAPPAKSTMHVAPPPPEEEPNA